MTSPVPPNPPSELVAQALPDRLLTLAWQSTVVEVEPATRYGSRTDAAAVSSALTIRNDTELPLQFPLILATTDAEDRTPRAARASDEEPEWAPLAGAIRTGAARRGLAGERVEHYLTRLRASVRRASRSKLVTLGPGEERFVRTYQRKLLSARGGAFELRALFPLPQFALAAGGTIGVVIALPPATERFAVEAIDWTRELASATLAEGRFVASWLWQDAEADVFVAYRYAERESAAVRTPSARLRSASASSVSPERSSRSARRA